MESTTPTRFTTGVRWAAAACLVVPVALNAVSHLFDPLTGDTATQLVGEAAAHPTAAAVTAVLKLLIPLTAGGALALAWLARRSARLALLGGAVLFVSYLATAYDLIDYFTVPTAVGRGPGVLAYVDAVQSTQAAGVAFLVAVVGNLLGYLVLGIALLRSPDVPRWIGALFVVFAVANLFSHEVAGASTSLAAVLEFAVFVLLTVASIGAARVLLRSGTPQAGSDTAPGVGRTGDALLAMS